MIFPEIKKIAVNVIGSYDLNDIHNDVINFLYPVIDELNSIQIDYFICNQDVTDKNKEYHLENSSVIYTPLVNEDHFLNLVTTSENRFIIKTLHKIFKISFRSYLNSIAIQQDSLNNIYGMVITYSPMIKDCKINSLLIEQDFLYARMSADFRPLMLDYDLCITNMSTFFKVVNLWHFLSKIDNSSKLHIADNNIHIFSSWLNMQNIRVRDLCDL